MRVESDRHHLPCVSAVRRNLFPRYRAPNLSRVVERPRAYLIPKRNVERHAINCVLMSLQRMNQVARLRIP